MWFRKYYRTNIFDLNKLIKQYWLTYDIIDQIFVLHSEDQEKPNMEFNMHESGLRCYNPTDETVLLINTIDRNKQEFSKRKINSRLSCDGPIHRHFTCNLGQKNCGFEREDHQEESNPPARVHIYNSQGNHQASQICIYDRRYILRKWNTIFISLSRKNIFTKISHLSDRKSITSFKALK